MKRIIDLIQESMTINEGGGVAPGRYGCGGGAPYGKISDGPAKLSREQIKSNICNNFALNVIDMLKNVKGTSKDRAKKKIEKSCQHLIEKAQSMNGGDFVKEFCEYIENF